MSLFEGLMGDEGDVAVKIPTTLRSVRTTLRSVTTGQSVVDIGSTLNVYGMYTQ